MIFHDLVLVHIMYHNWASIFYRQDDLMTLDGDVENSIPAFISRFGSNSNGNLCSPPQATEVEQQSACLLFPQREEFAVQGDEFNREHF